MHNKIIKNKNILISLCSLSLISSSIIAGSLFIIFNKPEHTSYNSANNDWILNSIKERQVIIKHNVEINKNNELFSDTTFYNGYFLNSNELIIPLKLQSRYLTISKKYSDIEHKNNVSYSTCANSENKNINKIEWINIPHLSMIKNCKQKVSTQNNIITIKNELIKSQGFSINSFLRESKEYKYIYSSLYLSNNTIKHSYQYVLLKELYNYEIRNLYELNNGGIESIIKKEFSISSNYHNRNIGSLNSILIDPVGNIIGFQMDQNKVNDVLFYGVKNE